VLTDFDVRGHCGAPRGCVCSVGLKLAQGIEQRLFGVTLAVGGMALSGLLLWLAQKEIALGSAYAVWTGIGAAGTFFVGVWFLGDATSLAATSALH
jgi:quaternary ammonium compound-resistance protein SugE